MRLWPVSREQMPKPYVNTVDRDETLLQATLRRAGCLEEAAAALVVCNQDHDFIVSAQAREVAANGVRLMLEPEGRNTAPAICAAALLIEAQGLDDLMLVLPADHVIKNGERFAEAAAAAADLAEKGYLVTFAIAPTSRNRIWLP